MEEYKPTDKDTNFKRELERSNNQYLLSKQSNTGSNNSVKILGCFQWCHLAYGKVSISKTGREGFHPTLVSLKPQPAEFELEKELPSAEQHHWIQTNMYQIPF